MQGRGQKFQNHSLWRNHLGSVWAPKKNPLTFHSTGWLIGILLMVYYNIYITGLYNPLYNLTNQGPFFHCSFKSSFFGWRFPRKLLRILTRILTAALTKTDSFREIRPSTKINMPDPIPPSQTLQIPLIFLGAFVNGTDFFRCQVALLVLPKYIVPVRLKHQLSHGHSPVRPNTRPKSFERSNKGLNNREQKHDWKTPIDGTWSGFQETPGRKDDETHSNNLETSQKSQFCKEMTFFKPHHLSNIHVSNFHGRMVQQMATYKKPKWLSSWATWVWFWCYKHPKGRLSHMTFFYIKSTIKDFPVEKKTGLVG